MPQAVKDSPIAQPPQASEADERTEVDWAFHAGTVDRVLARIQAKVEQRRRRRRRAAGGAAAVAIVLFVGAWLVPHHYQTFAAETEAGELRSLDFRDGSHAEISGCTELFADYRYGRRTVRLDRGEAFFQVARDPSHPFLVETPAGTVRVLGTSFNVRVAGENRVEVTLVEGAVTFHASGAPDRPLAPGEILCKTGAYAEVRTLTPAALEAASAWREGRLVLDGFTLGEVIERVAAFHGTAISVEPAALGLRPGGSCPLGDLTAILEALQSTLPIHVLEVSDGSYRIVLTTR